MKTMSTSSSPPARTAVAVSVAVAAFLPFLLLSWLLQPRQLPFFALELSPTYSVSLLLDCVWLLPQQAGNVAAVCKARLHCETADRGFFCFVCDGDINYVPADNWRSSVTIVELNNAEHKTIATKATPSPSHSSQDITS